MQNNLENSDKRKVQQYFLEKIKQLLPENVSFAEELAELLDVSTDSIYRRLRGETMLTIDEMAILCNKYKVSFDSNPPDEPRASFLYSNLKNKDDLNLFIFRLFEQVKATVNLSKKHFTYAAIDLPIFHFFAYPELLAFKMFYWLKAVINDPLYQDKKFDSTTIDHSITEVGKQMAEYYQQIPSTEIWNNSTINGVLQQIDFFWDSGNFKSKDDAIILCSQLLENFEMLEKQAASSSKILNDSSPQKENNFTLYLSEIVIGNNCLIAQRGDSLKAFISVHTFNIMEIQSEQFSLDTKTWIDNIIRKSTLISGVAEKQRYQFFKQARVKIEQLQNKIMCGEN
jgi:transcriptional regulator with XRE-family HTH domain